MSTRKESTFHEQQIPGAFAIMLFLCGPAFAVLDPTRGSAAVVADDTGLPTAAYDFTVLDVPGAGRTVALAMNAGGEVTGWYQPETLGSAPPMPFIYREGNYTTLTVPDADYAAGHAINDYGDVVGSYIDGGYEHGFIYRAGVVAKFDVPGALNTTPRTINAPGQVVGSFQDGSTGDFHSFRYSEGHYKVIKWPGVSANSINVQDINDRGVLTGTQIVTDPSQHSSATHGFTKRGRRISLFDCPRDNEITNPISINNKGRVAGTCSSASGLRVFLYKDGKMRTFTLRRGKGIQSEIFVSSINDSGRVIGGYYDPPHGLIHGFVLQQRRFYGLDVPGASTTTPTDINGGGEITGYFEDASGTHGFLAAPR